MDDRSLWNGCADTYGERSVVKSVIFITFKEVSVTVCVLKGSINVIWKALPIRQWFWICRLNWWPFQWVESPKFASFIEVNFAITAPY